MKVKLIVENKIDYEKFMILHTKKWVNGYGKELWLRFFEFKQLSVTSQNAVLALVFHGMLGNFMKEPET